MACPNGSPAHTCKRCLQIPKAVGALSKVEMARAKRGGKGKHSFKSKGKHKRR